MLSLKAKYPSVLFAFGLNTRQDFDQRRCGCLSMIWKWIRPMEIDLNANINWCWRKWRAIRELWVSGRESNVSHNERHHLLFTWMYMWPWRSWSGWGRFFWCWWQMRWINVSSPLPSQRLASLPPQQPSPPSIYYHSPPLNRCGCLSVGRYFTFSETSLELLSTVPQLPAPWRLDGNAPCCSQRGKWRQWWTRSRGKSGRKRGGIYEMSVRRSKSLPSRVHRYDPSGEFVEDSIIARGSTMRRLRRSLRYLVHNVYTVLMQHVLIAECV